MNIAWVFSENLFFPPAVDLTEIKNSAPIWGSWKLWRPYQIDNAVCANPKVADRLIAEHYHTHCNLYVPHTVKSSIAGVRHFGGTFDFAVPHIEDLVAMHLAAHLNDIVLVAGIEFLSVDYQKIFEKTVESYPNKQWVLVDYNTRLPKELTLPNLTCDKLKTVLNLLN
jgi:hypothetical protein